MAGAFLSVACACGRSASVPCPTVGDIPEAAEQFTGWGYDARGFVCCPECIAAGIMIERRQPAVQPDLFAEDARI